MKVSTNIGTVSNINTSGEQLTFNLRNNNGQSFAVECSDHKLNAEIKDMINDNDEVAVIGAVSEKQFFMDEKDQTIKAIVIIVNDTVYPHDFPKLLALKFRNDERERQKLLKVAEENLSPLDPF